MQKQVLRPRLRSPIAVALACAALAAAATPHTVSRFEPSSLAYRPVAPATRFSGANLVNYGSYWSASGSIESYSLSPTDTMTINGNLVVNGSITLGDASNSVTLSITK